jgi:RNA polymerase sigma factor (TIGR02999 family)
VHEAFLKLRTAEGMEFSDRSHFFAVACQSMRWILRDLAKGQMRDKRGGTNVRVSFDETHHGSAASHEVDAAQLNDLFQTFETQDPRAAQVAQLKVLMGLENAEIAGALKISEATVKRDWQMARAWLLRELGSNEPPKKNVAR